MEANDSPLFKKIAALIWEYRAQSITPRLRDQLAGRLRGLVLMDREALGLPEAGAATNFSDNEVAGRGVHEKVEETDLGIKTVVAEPTPEQALEVPAEEEKEEEVPVDVSKAPEAEGTKLRAIISLPNDTDEDGNLTSAPIAFKKKID